MIMEYMAANNSCRYLDVLPKIVDNYNSTHHTTIKTPAAVWASDHIGWARKNIRANVDKMLATKVKTKGVSTRVPKTGNYVRVSFVCLVGSEWELDLKGFCKHTGHNYSDDIYKVETIKPRKVSCNEFVISEAFVWVQGKCGPGGNGVAPKSSAKSNNIICCENVNVSEQGAIFKDNLFSHFLLVSKLTLSKLMCSSISKERWHGESWRWWPPQIHAKQESSPSINHYLRRAAFKWDLPRPL